VADGARARRGGPLGFYQPHGPTAPESRRLRATSGAMAHAERGGCAPTESEHLGTSARAESRPAIGILADPGGEGLERRRADPESQGEAAPICRRDPWSASLWLPCRDGKARPIEPSVFPLAYGVPNRVGTLRGAGNAIVPQVAAEFIGAYLDLIGGR
jgi:DNA (cytosine-5)-methyltransferase 1